MFTFPVMEHWTVYIRPAAGLLGRDVADVLSRGSDEWSRKLEVGYFLSTWLWPSSSKPDSTPCCLLCLLLSSRSFPKNASWTWKTKHWVNSHFTLPYQDCQFTFPGIILGKCITMWQREYSANIKGPHETDALKPSCCCWPHFCQHLPYPDTQLLSSMTCYCRSLLHQDIKSPMCCHFNNWLNVFHVFWTLSLVWTFPYCVGIKSSTDSCR